MLFEKLKEFINEYPKLKKVYQSKLDEGYTITNISARSLPPEKSFDIKSIEIHMENTNGTRIVINYWDGTINLLSVDEIPSRKGKIHDNLVLTKEMIHDKNFKKKLFGGYNEGAVDSFLDLIITDYKFIEDVLIKENKLLREDIKELRGK
ncbi:DivIVA domain-containing protein [Neobacillus sp. NPDC058068]|uniref:DivIVA domain-containing protein n=1 Tax=Neobacillus sp. NPDC058068 TaxID=3346325 RepID=UPI0036DD2B98